MTKGEADIINQKREQEQQHAEEDRHDPERGFVHLAKRRLRRQTRRNQREVIERRAVILNRVVAIGMPLEQVAELDRVDCLIDVHGTEVQPRQAQQDPRQNCYGEQQIPPFHLTGVP